MHNELKVVDMISTWHSIMKVVMVPVRQADSSIFFCNFRASRSIPALSRTGICHIEALAELQKLIGFRLQFMLLGWGWGVNLSIKFG